MEIMTDRPLTRRGFLVLLPGALLALHAGRGSASSTASRTQQKHPTPRPGIDASKVLAAKDLDDHAETRHAFELVREIPQVADGIRCHCGCDVMDGYYSLLSCFEKDGMAQDCEICRGNAVMAHRLHRAGKTLDQIRAAIDAERR